MNHPLGWDTDFVTISAKGNRMKRLTDAEIECLCNLSFDATPLNTNVTQQVAAEVRAGRKLVEALERYNELNSGPAFPSAAYYRASEFMHAALAELAEFRGDTKCR